MNKNKKIIIGIVVILIFVIFLSSISSSVAAVLYGTSDTPQEADQTDTPGAQPPADTLPPAESQPAPEDNGELLPGAPVEVTPPTGDDIILPPPGDIIIDWDLPPPPDPTQPLEQAGAQEELVTEVPPSSPPPADETTPTPAAPSPPAAPGTPPPPPPVKGVRLYNDFDFKGEYTDREGKFSLADTPFANKAKSIKLQSGCRVSLYDKLDHTGTCKTFTADQKTLEGTGLKADVASGEVVCGDAKGPYCPGEAPLPPVKGVRFFSNSDFKGEYVDKEGKFSLANTPWANRAKSFQLQSGCRASLYDKDNYTGTCKTFTANQANLGGSGLNEDIASGEVVCGTAKGPYCPDEAPYTGIKVYTTGAYGGQLKTYGPGKHVLTSPFLNNIASFKLSKGCKASVYDKQDYSGTCKTFSSDQSTLEGTGIRNDIGSMEVQCNQDGPYCPADAPFTGIKFFTGANYTGNVGVYGKGKSALQDPIRNNVQSFKLSPGCRASLYDKFDYTGNCKTFTSDKSSLSGTGLNKDIASVEVRCGTETGPYCPADAPFTGIRMFTGGAYTGSIKDYGQGKHVLTSPFLNNVASFKLSQGCKASVYDKQDYSGTCKTFSSDQSTLEGTGIRNDIGSMEVRCNQAGPYCPADAPFTGIKFFTGANYTGNVGVYGTGKRALVDPIRNNVQSFQLSSGCRASLYDKYDYTGNCKTFTGSKSSLSGTGLNNDIASVEVQCGTIPGPYCPADAPFTGVKLFRGSNYTGDTLVRGTGRHSLANNPMANAASSLKLSSGCRVAAYDKDNYTGTCKVFTSNQADLGGSGLNSDIASLEVQCGTTQGPYCPSPAAPPPSTSGWTGVRLYNDINYGGDYATFGPGNHSLGNSPLLNKASSLQVSSGCNATVFDKQDYTGSSRTFTGNVSTLGGTGLNDDIGSVRVSCPTPPPPPAPAPPPTSSGTYTTMTYQRISAGDAMWTQNGSEAQCKAKCDATPGCYGFSRDPNGWCYGSRVISPRTTTIGWYTYLRNAPATGTPPPPPPPPPAPAPAPTASTGSYTAYSNRDITPGTDLWAHTGTLDSCKQKCDAQSTCQGFSIQGSNCWGKSSRNLQTGNSTIYLKNTTPTPAPTVAPGSYTAYSNRDITPGTDLWAHTGTLDSCKQKCDAQSTCQGFSIQGSNCWGKSSRNLQSGNSTIYLKNTTTTSTTPTSSLPDGCWQASGDATIYKVYPISKKVCAVPDPATYTRLCGPQWSSHRVTGSYSNITSSPKSSIPRC